MNPARDFGPRRAQAILRIGEKENSDWGYALVPILGPSISPLVAGGIGAVIIKLVGIR
ncbi:MAG: hypothetical protein ACHP9V_06505 [Terriglobales bacterium]